MAVLTRALIATAAILLGVALVLSVLAQAPAAVLYAAGGLGFLTGSVALARRIRQGR